MAGYLPWRILAEEKKWMPDRTRLKISLRADIHYLTCRNGCSHGQQSHRLASSSSPHRLRCHHSGPPHLPRALWVWRHPHTTYMYVCCEPYLRLLAHEIPDMDIRIPHLQYESRVEYIWCSYTKMIIILRKKRRSEAQATMNSIRWLVSVFFWCFCKLFLVVHLSEASFLPDRNFVECV